MKKEDNYKTILTMVGGFLVLYFLTKAKYDAFLYVSLGVAISSILSSYLASKIVWLWMTLAKGLGYVNSRVLLSLIFFVFLVPIAFLYKLFNKDTLQLSKLKQGGSYYETRNHQYVKRDLEKPW